MRTLHPAPCTPQPGSAAHRFLPAGSGGKSGAQHDAGDLSGYPVPMPNARTVRSAVRLIFLAARNRILRAVVNSLLMKNHPDREVSRSRLYHGRPAHRRETGQHFHQSSGHRPISGFASDQSIPGNLLRTGTNYFAKRWTLQWTLTCRPRSWPLPRRERHVPACPAAARLSLAPGSQLPWPCVYRSRCGRT